MRLGIASWSFILIALLAFLMVVKEGGARKIAITSGGDNPLLKLLPHDLQKLATDGLGLTNIMQVEEDADVEEQNKKPAVKKDDDDDDSDDESDDDDHKKKGGKRVHKEEGGEEHKKIKGKDKKLSHHHMDQYNKMEPELNGLWLTNIMQVEEDADVEEQNKKPPVKKDDDEEHKKKGGKRVHKEEEEGEEEHKKIKGKDKKSSHHHMDDHYNKMEPELNVFFTPKDLLVGKTMPIYFGKKDSSTSPKFLPREESNQIPFSSKQLSSLLKFFSFSKHSPQAKAMKYTLKQCELEPMEGETKFCATSLESLLDFASYLFGSNAQFRALTTTHLTNSTVLLQNYTISQVKQISVPNVIGCHPMPYPYAVFYCHSQHSDTNLYEVLVQGEDGGRVQAAAICHMDTTKWDTDHVSFRVLKIQPGSSPVCHFFPPDNLVWVPLTAP